MKTSLLFVSLSFCCCILFAQTRNPAQDINRANVWHFGAQSGAGTLDAPSLHFTEDSVFVENHGWGGEVSSLCDSLGNLQVYGGAFKLRNRVDSLMKNSGFIGDSGWVNILQMALAVPKPENPDMIYYFTSSVDFRYTVINMQGDNGKGEVVKKNIRLYPGTVGVKLTAVHHCNGSDIWVVGHEWGSNKFFAYLVTENGIDTVPVISGVGPVDNYAPTYQGGAIKFSPDGNKLAYSSGGGVIPLYLFDFDKSDGIISNPIPLHTVSGIDGLSFSSDSHKLYFGNKDGLIVQYNVESGDSATIVASRKTVFNQLGKPITHMQLGRNGKIYVQQGGLPDRYYLGVINNPDLPDTLCDFEPFGISLNNARGGTDGIMNTVESFFYKGTSAYPCYGDTTDTTVNNLLNDDFQFQTRAYPNPFEDYTLIEIENFYQIKEKVDYQLYDALGQECKAHITELNSGNYEIRAKMQRGQLKAGMYFLHVKTKYQTITIKLFIL